MVTVDHLERFRSNDIKRTQAGAFSSLHSIDQNSNVNILFLHHCHFAGLLLPSVRNIINIAASTSLQQIHRPASMSAKLLQNFIITARHKWAAYEAHAVSHLRPRFLGGCL